MITDKYILEKLSEFLRTPAGRNYVKKNYGIDVNALVDAGTTKRKKAPNETEMYKIGEEMKQLLFNYVNPLIKSITLDDIIVGDPKKMAGGTWYMDISFREGSLHRDSLIEDYGGVNNIVLLFAKGYHASKYVHGTWKFPNGGSVDNVWSVRDRDGNDFLIRAVEAFNNKYGGKNAVAELKGEYRECSENPQ